MKEIGLSRDEQRIFAEIALNWKYDEKGEGKHIPLTADDVLQARRHEDKKDDLWTTYQRVQENTLISLARRAAVVSVEKNGLPVPAAKMTILLLSR